MEADRRTEADFSDTILRNFLERRISEASRPLSRQSPQGKVCDDAFVEATLRADVDARCAGLAPYKKVKRVLVYRQEFAKTTTGKIKRQSLVGEMSATAARAAGVA